MIKRFESVSIGDVRVAPTPLVKAKPKTHDKTQDQKDDVPIEVAQPKQKASRKVRSNV